VKSLVRTSRGIGGSLALLALLVAMAYAPAAAQQPAQRLSTTPTSSSTAKKVLSVNDYTRWRGIDGAQMSGDGRWVIYGLRFTNTAASDAKPVLHILNLETNKEVEVANATQAVFSSDSRWVSYQIEPPGGGRGGRGGRGGGPGGTDTTAVAPIVAPVVPPGGAPGVPPGSPTVPPTSPPTVPPAVTPGAPGAPTVPAVTPPDAQPTSDGRGRGAGAPAPMRRLELRELATGRVQSWQDVQSATFSPTSSHLLMRRRPAGAGTGASAAADAAGGGAGGGRGGAPAPTSGPRGVDVVLHHLATGRSQFFGSVGDIAFNKAGDLLAYTVDAAVRDGNGLFVVDLKSGRSHVLDNDARNYNRLTWSEDGTALAVLKGREVDRMRERDNALLAFADVRAALDDAAEYAPTKLDPTTAAGFPKGWVISDRTSLAWSDDNRRVFLGIITQTPAPDTSRRRSADSVADVDVWRTQDERIQSVQMTRADADRNFTYREAFDVRASKYIRLADSTMRDLDIAQDGRWAVGRDTRGYISDYKRPQADLYRVNTSTGERTLMLKGQLTGAHIFGISPNGRHFLYWKDNKYQAYDLDAGTTKTLGAGSPVSFVDLEYDHPGPKPSYGIAGYTSDGKAVIAQNRYDLWLFPLDGTTAARNLTAGTGARNEIRFRYIRTVPIDPLAPRTPDANQGIDLSKPVTLSAYGEYTKKSGFYELADGKLREIVYDDAAFSTPIRAQKADKFLFTRQTFIEFPDLRVSGADFKSSKKITDANPQQAEYAWGRRVLFDFKNKDGLRLQGILALPDDYQPGEKRPMIVNFYEDNSQNLHRYSAPSFLTGMGGSPMEAVSRGYITMLPDIHFRTGSSHSDMLECVEAATRKVIEMGYADPKHIGINGHSYGGEGAAFIGTRSRMFAAVGMGAGVTDLYTDFSQSWGWSYQVSGGSGANGNDYYLYGQGRWGVSPWDKPDLYRFESAITHVREATAPFLIMHGTADPTVSFSEGMNFYNALRYNGKDAILLAYPGEGHGLRGLANRRDLTIRYFQFFDHYLKGAPAPKWMTDGVPYLAKDALRDPGVTP
jgi:dipeptidyl aminopeptidase/acylaminoacyl peptidase